MARGEAKEYEVAGRRLICPVCNETRFRLRRPLLTTRWLAFVNYEWTSPRALAFVCEGCGHILWFERR